VPNEKQLWVLAGGNGAGKTTFFKHYLTNYGIKFVNADLIAKEINPSYPEKSAYEALTIAATIRDDLVSQGESFCYETVCHRQSENVSTLVL